MSLIIGNFSEKDIDERVRWINHRTVSDNMYFDYPASLNSTIEWYKSLAGRKNRKDFSIYIKEDNICVGMSGLTDIDFINLNAEFYVLVNPDRQGNGYGKVITKWTINYGFLKFPLNKLYLFTDESNSIAIKIYESLGFIKEGIQREHKYKNGGFKNRLMFSLLRSEWQSLAWHKEEIDLLLNVS